MDTDEHEPRLLRRIEELAAQAGGEDAPEGPVLAAALADLRAEVGALRADLTSLRADLSAVRTGVDTGIGRLAGDVAAGRAEAGDAAGRHAELTDRVNTLAEMLDEVAAALPEIRSEIAQLPAGTAAIGTELERLEETLLTRVDTAVGDLRRTVSAGLTQASAGGRAAEAAANDTRSVLEERLAAVEDTIDGLAENLEAVTRDSLGVATEHIRTVDRNLDALGGSLAEAVAAGHGATQEQAEQLALQLRDIVEGAFAGLDSRLSRDRDSATGGLDALRGFLEAFQASTETRLEELENAIGAGLTDARDALMGELTATIEELTAASGDTRRLVENEVSALRGDLADALEEVRDRISTLLTDSTSAISGALDEQRTTFGETVRVLREDVLDRVEQSRADVLSTLDELRSGVSSAARAGEETGVRLRELAEVIGSLYATIGELRIEWDARSEAAVQSAREAAEAATAEFRAEVDAMMDGARAAMDRQTAAVDETAAMLNGGVGRLVTAGEALLGYLAQRDRLLERERDRVLHDALDAFAAGLSPKERRATASRLGDVLDRRRDARDAERWRRSEAAAPAVAVPPPPEDLAALVEPIHPRGIRGSAQRRGAAAEAAAPPEPAAAPGRRTSARPASGKKTAAKKSSGSARTSTTTATRAAKAPAAPAGPRRRRASVSEMPVVPSPDVALEAAVAPAPPVEAAVPAPDVEVPAAEPVAPPEPPPADGDTAEAGDAAVRDATVDQQPAGEDEPVEPAAETPPKPWWNPTGGSSDEPKRGDSSRFDDASGPAS